MTTTLRFFLVIASLLTVIWILRKIRKMKVVLKDLCFFMLLYVILHILWSIRAMRDVHELKLDITKNTIKIIDKNFAIR